MASPVQALRIGRAIINAARPTLAKQFVKWNAKNAYKPGLTLIKAAKRQDVLRTNKVTPTWMKLKKAPRRVHPKTQPVKEWGDLSKKVKDPGDEFFLKGLKGDELKLATKRQQQIRHKEKRVRMLAEQVHSRTPKNSNIKQLTISESAKVKQGLMRRSETRAYAFNKHKLERRELIDLKVRDLHSPRVFEELSKGAKPLAKGFDRHHKAGLHWSRPLFNGASFKDAQKLRALARKHGIEFGNVQANLEHVPKSMHQGKLHTWLTDYMIDNPPKIAKNATFEQRKDALEHMINQLKRQELKFKRMKTSPNWKGASGSAPRGSIDPAMLELPWTKL